MALGSRSNKRRRRRRSSSVRTAAQPARVSRRRREFRLHTMEMLASLGVGTVMAALIALVWINASRSTDAERSETRARIEATISGQAVVLADEIRREMLGVEQSLRILKQAFQADPTHFNMKAWRDQMPALTDVTNDVFVADAELVVRHDINPDAIGLPIGTRIAAVVLPMQPGRDDSLLIGPTVQVPPSRQHLSFLMIRLDRPGGWLVGATYRTESLTRLYAEASLGVQGMTALVNTRLGRVQTVAGPASADPRYDIAKSDMYAAMDIRPDGTWTGRSAPDDVQRIHAFRRVPGRDLAVVVAVNQTEAMKSATAWAEAARSLAWVATLIVLAGAALVLRVVWTIRATRRRREALDRERAIVAATQSELSELRGRFDATMAQLRALLGVVQEGALVLDPEMRVVEWNQPFLALFGVAAEALQPGRPLDELLRAQAVAGAFGSLEDIEAEVARRVAQLRTASAAGAVLYVGADGRALGVTTTRLADGSLVLVVREATGQEQPPVPMGQPEPAEWQAPAIEPTQSAGPMETL